MSVARARLRQAEAQGEAALAAFDGKVITALKDVEQALAIVATEQRRLAALREAQDRSERAYELADRRYRAGSIGWLDVLVAQSDLLAARASHAASQRRLSLARVDLFKALGGGWRQARSTERALLSERSVKCIRLFPYYRRYWSACWRHFSCWEPLDTRSEEVVVGKK